MEIVKIRENTLNVVLGGTRNVGHFVVEELRKRNLPVRIVARTPIKDSDFMQGDMSNAHDMQQVLEGAKTVYVCSSFPYSTKVWQQEWPIFMERLIDIAAAGAMKIVYLDNTYLYGPAPLQNPITEDHPSIPVSQKGEIRKMVTEKLIEAAAAKKVDAVIGRSANFVTPVFKVGLLYNSFLEKMLMDKDPDYLGNPNAPQTFSYVPDVARALVELGVSDFHQGEVFHLPVLDPLPPVDILSIFNQVLKTNLKIKELSKGMQRFLGLFSPILKELLDTRYQTDSAYVMDDSKFREAFPAFEITPTTEAYQQVVRSFIQA
jgi:nucleoside-diphosphate-sugar epimerase